jgi:murein DD-endopeptidase MepM/ murein hydrolase activator NlpD
MTHFLPRTALLALAAFATSAGAATPTYPIRLPAAQAPGPATPMDENGDPLPAGAQAAPGAAPIESGVLTPVKPMAPVQSTDLAPPPARDTTPTPTPTPTPTTRPEPQSQSAPPPRVERPPVPVTTTKVITLAPGKVVDIDGRPKTYTVKEGQGLDAVARAMGSTRAELAKINGLKEPYKLKPGQVLKGPASRAKAYVVAPGDTMFAIAKRFNVKAADLADENNLTINSAIRPGQKLRLPAGYKDSGPTKKTITVTEDEPAPPVSRPPVKPPVTPPAPPLKPVVKPDTSPTTQPVSPPVKPPVTPTRPPVTPPVVQPTTPPVGRPQTPPAQPTVRLDPDCGSRQPSGLTSGPSSTSDRMLPDGAPPPLTDAQITTLGRGCFAWPVDGQVLSAYGPKGGGQRNDGVNIGAVAGTPVRAAATGKVVYSGGDVPGFGVTVLIQHENGWVTVYGHLAKAEVRMQQQVVAGQQIGTVGMTGGVPTPQLHFEIRYSPSPKYKAKAVDPGLVLPRNR